MFDISGGGGGAVIPFSLATGDFDVAFTVTGRILVNTTPGSTPPTCSFSDAIRTARGMRVLSAAGAAAGFFSADLGDAAHGDRRSVLLGRGADGEPTLHRPGEATGTLTPSKGLV